ncbi:NifU family protein, partial [Cutibacterium granulosum]|uniref:NifU family protein n=1 Tax=Cutibacterium granulosum TaxID=33011 RepID=UPI002B223BF9
AVRSALGRALSETTRWQGGDDSRELDDDAALAMFATELIDGPIGEIARAHGGSIELVSANKGVVSVRMSGACRGCPAAAITMHQRLKHQLRRRFPDLREVVEVGAASSTRTLPLSPLPATSR